MRENLNILEDLEELKEYRQLGTVEELSKRIPEEKVLKFYYCESLDKYLVGMRVGNFYYAELTENHDLCMIMSRYLPWGEHVVDPTTLWKEHTYPSEPKEIPFSEWLKGYMSKQSKQDVPDTNVGKWIPVTERLPKQNERIIGTFYNGNGHVFVCEDHFFVDELTKPYPLTAWMPLPEPYKGDK